eukprot:TRINITY_DN514_c0_g1_i1.p2 TRINITY_DN514_c0_g1~~TRINITY_DN514_c0_g1_i1.p2  ORF type:complete len:105 (+),score=22.25 TRINITY_DN514_c0_g1_i1:25-315(+)
MKRNLNFNIFNKKFQDEKFAAIQAEMKKGYFDDLRDPRLKQGTSQIIDLSERQPFPQVGFLRVAPAAPFPQLTGRVTLVSVMHKEFSRVLPYALVP